MTPRHRRQGLSYFWLALLVLLIAVLGVGTYVLYLGISTSLQAEENLHATLFTIRLVEQFVHEKERWPSGWDELEGLPFPNSAPSPLSGELSVVRIGGQHGYEWPGQADHLKRRVLIDFQPDLKAVAIQNPMEFTAIKPIGSYCEYRDYGFVQSLQLTLTLTMADNGAGLQEILKQACACAAASGEPGYGLLLEIAVAQAKAGDSAAAINTLDRCLDDARHIKDRRDRRWFLARLAEVRAEAGDVAGALRTVRDIDLADTNAYAQSLVALAQAKAGQIKAAMETADAIDPKEHRAFARAFIAIAQAEVGDFDAGIRTAKSLDTLASSNEPNRKLILADRDFALKEIAVAQAKAGRMKESAATVGMIGNAAVATRASSEIAALRGEKSPDATPRESKEAGPYQKAVALREIAVAQAKTDPAKAAATFQEALQAAAAIAIGGGTDVIAIREVARAQAKTGDIVAAAKTFQQARQAAMRYKDESYIAHLLQGIASDQAEGGDAAGVLAWARALTSPIQRGNALLGVASGMLRRAKASGAILHKRQQGVPPGGAGGGKGP
jgi:tetratricopeptide (TPR) repeat protein